MATNPLPTLTTPRLVLRPFEPDDAPRVHQLAGNVEVAATTLHIPHPYPDGLAAAWIASHAPAWAEDRRATFAITVDDVVIGAVSLEINRPHLRGELGYWIARDEWGKGYATEAAMALRDFGFDTVGLNRVQAHHMTRNPASGRVMAKLGMRFEGVHRQEILKGGRFEDVAVWAVCRDEWEGALPGRPPSAPGR